MDLPDTYPGLGERIRNAVAQLETESPTPDELAGIDHFHTAGARATEGLANFGKIAAQDRVLDVGAGLGGPARWLMAHYRCEVVCVDLTEEFCEAARMLNDLTGYQPEIVCGDILGLQLADESFDVAWAQNAFMNIEDKERLFTELNKVLKPGGRLVFQELMAGPGDRPFAYPVPWASSANQNFLVSPDKCRRVLERSGFIIRGWEDKNEWWHSLPPPPIGPGLADWVPDWGVKASNTGLNADAKLIGLWWVVAVKPAIER